MHREVSLPSIHCRQNQSVSFERNKINIMSRLGHEQRKWFQKRGKTQSIIFTKQMLSKLRDYFNDLDLDKSGAITQNQLQDPLITLQFCSSKEQVKKLIDSIDLDGSGQVQFPEFLEIFRKLKTNKYTNPQEKQRFQTFIDMFNQQKVSSSFGKQKSYRLAISELRRKKLISDLTNQQIIKPRQKRYQKKKKQMPNFLKKIEKQFLETPELNSILTNYRTKDYYRVKLGKKA